MVLYQYRCVTCHTEIALWRRRENRNDKVLCPECGTRCKRDFTTQGLGTFHKEGTAPTAGNAVTPQAPRVGIPDRAAVRVGPGGGNVVMIGNTFAGLPVVISPGSTADVIMDANWISGVPYAVHNHGNGRLDARGNVHSVDDSGPSLDE